MWWSYILTAVGITGLYFAGKKKAVGWAIGLCAQTLWLTYGIVSHQYGFILSAVAYGYVYAKNYYSWEKDRKCQEQFESKILVRQKLLAYLQKN